MAFFPNLDLTFKSIFPYPLEKNRDEKNWTIHLFGHYGFPCQLL
jgi:hypothetical protein